MATFTATPDATNGRIALNINWSDTPAVTTVTITRTDPDGRERPVRNAEPLTLSSGIGVIYDHEAPFNQSVSYEASSAQTATVLTIASATVTSSRVWLKHPLLPDLNRQVTIAAAPQLTYPARRTLHEVLRRSDPVAVTDTRGAPSGSVSFVALTADDWESLQSLFEDGTVLLLAGIPDYYIGNWFISAGDVTFRKPGPQMQSQERIIDVPFDVVERPAGSAAGAAEITYAEVLAVYSSYTALKAGESTYLDLLSGVGT